MDNIKPYATVHRQVLSDHDELSVAIRKNVEISYKSNSRRKKINGVFKKANKVNPTVKEAMEFIEVNGPEMLKRNNAMVQAYVKMNDQKQASL